MKLLLLGLCLSLPFAGPTVPHGGPIGAQCPFDTFQATWTGRTQIINGKTWFVMRCPQGHESLAESAN
jgi:hypothetical protein